MLTMSIFPFNLLIHLVLLNAKTSKGHPYPHPLPPSCSPVRHREKEREREEGDRGFA